MSAYHVTAEQVIACGWREGIGDSTIGYPEMWQAFVKESKRAQDEGRSDDSRALHLLADVVSMSFDPTNTNTPFGPYFSSVEGRSSTLDDFSPEDVNALFGACNAIDHPLLKARLADIVWLSQIPRNADAARTACDAYASTPLTPETSHKGALDARRRAISLLRQLGRSEHRRMERLEEELIERVREAVKVDGFYLKQVSRVLLEGRLAGASALEFAQLLEARAQEFSTKGDHRAARIYFEDGAEWFSIAKQSERRLDCQFAAAESYVDEAEARLVSASPSHMVAASFYEEAIQAYRRLPKEARIRRGREHRIDEIHAKMSESGEKALTEMVSIQSETIDLTDVAEQAKDAVRGLSMWDAVLTYSRLYNNDNAAKRKARVEKSMRDNPLTAMVNKTHYSSDGRVVAVTPGYMLNEANHPDSMTAVLAEMIRNYSFDISVTVRAVLFPAYKELLLEHRIRPQDMIELARQSPLVPVGREQLVGKAIFYGFDGDHETALHLLVPQIEHIVRVRLNQQGVKTTTLGKDGIETENGLSTIASFPQVDDIFGQEVAFELRALFCSPYGPNLRNELAHGLLGSADCQSEHSFYAWWFLLRLTVRELAAAQVRQRKAAQAATVEADQAANR